MSNIVTCAASVLRENSAEGVAGIRERRPASIDGPDWAINPLFETSSARYDWLNRVVALGIGHRRADGPVYSVFEVL